MAKQRQKSAETTPSGDAASDVADQNFDQILEKLAEIVEQLERADLPLEKSLQEFERGVRLSQRGQAILDAAERRVEVLLRDGTTTALEE